jgi:hypothetical protein
MTGSNIMHWDTSGSATQINAGICYVPTNITASYTVQDGDYLITVSGSGTIEITLPLADDYPGRELIFKAIGDKGGSSWRIAKQGSDTIDGFAGKPAFSGERGFIRMISNGGARWGVVRNGTP